MATSDSEKVLESSSVSSHYRRSTSPEVACFSEPEIMPKEEETMKGAQREGDKVWKRKNALKKKKFSDTGPPEAVRQSFSNGGSFKRSNSNPELLLHSGSEGEEVNEQQKRRRGVQFLQGSPLSKRHLVTKSAGISRIQPSPLVTSSLTYYTVAPERIRTPTCNY